MTNLHAFLTFPFKFHVNYFNPLASLSITISALNFAQNLFLLRSCCKYLSDKILQSSPFNLHSKLLSASMKSFIDDSKSPFGQKKRKRSFKTSDLDLPVDSNFPILQKESNDSLKVNILQ